MRGQASEEGLGCSGLGSTRGDEDDLQTQERVAQLLRAPTILDEVVLAIIVEGQLSRRLASHVERFENCPLRVHRARR